MGNYSRRLNYCYNDNNKKEIKVFLCDQKDVPDLYIDWNYTINACTIGAENPIIILNSGLIDLCTDEEIMFIIGHEVGHIKSNHMLYHMMAQVINYFIDATPGGTLVAGGLQFALYYWSRMSEFTADRAGLMCCQDPEAMARAFIKMAGLPQKEFDNIRTDTFLQQARDFKMLDYDGMNKVVKFLSIADGIRAGERNRRGRAYSLRDHAA